MDEKNLINKEPDIKKVLKDYQEWIDKTTLAPSKAVYFVMFVAVIAHGILVRNHNGEWYVFPILLIAIVCFSILVRKEGHREGYIAGFESGYVEGRDGALGINYEMRSYLDEVEKDKIVEEITKKSASQKKSNKDKNDE